MYIFLKADSHLIIRLQIYSYTIKAKDKENVELIEILTQRILQPLASGTRYHAIYNILNSLQSCATRNENKRAEISENDLIASRDSVSKLVKSIHEIMENIVKKSDIVLTDYKNSAYLPKKYFQIVKMRRHSQDLVHELFIQVYDPENLNFYE